jgi:Ran GTPase-activating protein (RanGAP) involved in mRNA processing and transport
MAEVAIRAPSQEENDDGDDPESAMHLVMHGIEDLLALVLSHLLNTGYPRYNEDTGDMNYGGAQIKTAMSVCKRWRSVVSTMVRPQIQQCEFDTTGYQFSDHRRCLMERFPESHLQVCVFNDENRVVDILSMMDADTAPSALVSLSIVPHTHTFNGLYWLTQVFKLRKSMRVVSIKLHGHDFRIWRPDRVEDIVNYMGYSTTLVDVRFSLCTIPVWVITVLAAQMRNNYRITHFVLSGCILTRKSHDDPRSIMTLIGALEGGTALTNLVLSGTKLWEEDVRMLCAFLRTNKTISSLGLRGCGIEDSGVREIANMLEVNTTLTSLHMGKNSSFESASHYLLRSLTVNSTLRTLSLQGFEHMGFEARMHIGDYLSMNRGLVRLCLSQCRLDDETGLRIADGLAKNKTLTNLDMFSTGLGKHAVAALAALLVSEESALDSLDVNLNTYSDRLCNEIRSNPAMAGRLMMRLNSTDSTSDEEDSYHEKQVWTSSEEEEDEGEAEGE